MLSSALKLKLIVGAGAVAFLLAAGGAIAARHYRAKLGQATVGKLNAEARLDSTRAVNEKAQDILGDSLAGVTRLALQTVQERDRLDKALGIQRSAIAGIRFEISQLRTLVTSSAPTTESPDGVRSATFNVDTVPYFGTIKADLPRAPSPGRIAIDLSLRPAPISLRLGCLAARRGDNGVRRASATLVTPPWLTASIDSVSQDPSICNPSLGQKKSTLMPAVAGAAAGVGVGWLIFR